MRLGRSSSGRNNPQQEGLLERLNSARSPQLRIEICVILAYAKDADEFVRLSCRGHAGWRRDEWAYSPLFIWANFLMDLHRNCCIWAVRCGFPGERFLRLGCLGTMAAKLEEIRLAAARVAASHGLDLVDIELVGPSKERILRVFLEKNAEGRARLKAVIEAAASGAEELALPERLVEGWFEASSSFPALHMRIARRSAGILACCWMSKT